MPSWEDNPLGFMFLLAFCFGMMFLAFYMGGEGKTAPRPGFNRTTSKRPEIDDETTMKILKASAYKPIGMSIRCPGTPELENLTWKICTSGVPQFVRDWPGYINDTNLQIESTRMWNSWNDEKVTLQAAVGDDFWVITQWRNEDVWCIERWSQNKFSGSVLQDEDESDNPVAYLKIFYIKQDLSFPNRGDKWYNCPPADKWDNSKPYRRNKALGNFWRDDEKTL